MVDFIIIYHGIRKCLHSCRTSPCLMGKSTNFLWAIFNSYVKLPEGICKW